jgi:hypothetical protein
MNIQNLMMPLLTNFLGATLNNLGTGSPAVQESLWLSPSQVALIKGAIKIRGRSYQLSSCEEEVETF